MQNFGSLALVQFLGGNHSNWISEGGHFVMSRSNTSQHSFPILQLLHSFWNLSFDDPRALLGRVGLDNPFRAE